MTSQPLHMSAPDDGWQRSIMTGSHVRREHHGPQWTDWRPSTIGREAERSRAVETHSSAELSALACRGSCRIHQLGSRSIPSMIGDIDRVFLSFTVHTRQLPSLVDRRPQRRHKIPSEPTPAVGEPAMATTTQDHESDPNHETPPPNRSV